MLKQSKAFGLPFSRPDRWQSLSGLLLFLIFLSSTSMAATLTWDGSAGDDWTRKQNWTPQGATGPVAGDTVIISNATDPGGIVLIDTANQACATITIQSGMSFRVNQGFNLTVSGVVTNNSGGIMVVGDGSATVLYCGGNWDNNGIFNYNIGGGNNGTVEFNNSGNIDADGSGGTGTGAFWNMTVSGTHTLTSNVTVDNDLLVSGTLNLNGYTLTVNGTTTVTGIVNVGSGTLTAAGNLVTTGGTLNNDTGTVNLAGSFTSGTYNAGASGTFNYNGTTQTVAGLTYRSLKVTGSAATLGNNVTVNTSCLVDSSGSLDIATYTMTFANGTSLTVNGTFVSASGTLTSSAGGSYFAIALGGTVNITSLAVTRPDNNGLTINSSAVITRLDSVAFTGGQNGGSSRYLYFGQTSGNVTTNGCSFDANCNWNVVAPSGITVSMVNTSGAKGGTTNGELNDGSIDGNITWANPVTWNGSVSSSWNNGANWSTGTVPASDAVVIIDGVPVNQPIVDVDVSVFSVQVQSGATITMSSPNKTLEIRSRLLGGQFIIDNGGTVTMPGTGTILKIGGTWSKGATGTFTAGNGAVHFHSEAISQDIPVETFNDLVIDKPNDKTATAAGIVTVTGNFSIDAGEFNTGTYPHTVTGTTSVFGTLSIASGGTMNCRGAATVKAGGTMEMVSGSTLALETSLTVDNGVTDGAFNASGGTVTWYNSTRYAFTVNGQINVTALTFDRPGDNGLTLANGSTVVALDNVSYTNGVGGTNTYLRVLDTGSTAYYFNNHVIDTNCLYNVYAVSTNPSINMVQATGAKAGAAFENDPGTVINWFNEKTWLGGKNPNVTYWNVPQNWSGGTVPTNAEYVRILNQADDCEINIAGAVCKGAVIDSGGGIMYVTSGSVTIGEYLNIESGGTVILNNNNTITVGANWTNNGLFTLSGGTASGAVIFNGTSTLDKTSGSAGTETFDDLTISGNLTLTDTDSIKVNGIFNPSGGVFNAGSGTTVTTTGSWTAAPATFNRGTSTVVLQGTANVPAVTYHNLTIDGACTLTSDITVKNDLVINAGKSLNLSTFTITVEGDVTNSGTLDLDSGKLILKSGFTTTGTFTADTGTVEFSGSLQTVTAATYYTIDINGSTATLDTAVTATNGVNVLSGTLNLGANTLTLGSGATLDVDGTMTSTGATITSAGNYGINIDGTVNIDGLTINKPNDNGLTIQATAVVQALDNVTFTNGQNGGSSRYLWLGHSSGTYTFTGHSIDANCNQNVIAPNGAIVSMVNSSGAKGGTVNGEANDGAVDNNITWNDPNIWNGSGGSLWNTASSWSKSAVPVAADVVMIPNVTNDPVLNVNGVCSGIIIQNGGLLTLSTASVTLTVTGNVNINTGGTLTMSAADTTIALSGSWSNSGTFNPTNGKVRFNASLESQTVPVETFYNLDIDLDGQVATTGGLITVNNNLSVTNGTLRLDNQIMNVSGTVDVSGNLELLAGGDLKATGAVTVNSGGVIDLQGACTLRLGTSLTVNGGAPKGKLVASGTTPTITWDALSRYSFTVNGEIDVNGLNINYPDANGLTLANGATLTKLDALDFNNGVASTGTYLRILETGPVTWLLNQHDFDNNCQYNVYAADITPTVTMIGATGAKAGENYDNDPGTVITWTDQNVWDGSVDTTWNTAANWSENAVPTSASNTFVPNVTNNCLVNVNNAAANTVQIGAVGVMRIGNANTDVLTVSDSITIDTDGTLVLQNDSTLNVAGNWTNNGTFTLNSGTTSGTVVFNGTTALDKNTSGAGSETFDNLTVSSTLTIADDDSVVVTGTFNPTGSTFNAGGGTTLTTTGNWTAAPATFNRGTSTVVLQGTANVPAVTYYNLTIDGVCTLTSNITVKNNLVINAGDSLNLGTFTITVEGNVANSGTLDLDSGKLIVKGSFTPGTFTADTGTVEFAGTSQTVTSATYYTINVNGSTATLDTAVTATNGINVLTGTLALGANTLTLGSGATLDVDGTMTGAGATITSAGNYGINIDGTVNIDGLTVNRPNDNGLTIQSTAVIQALANVTFTNGQNGGSSRYLWLGHSSGTYTLSGHSFDANCNQNVIAPNGAIVSMVNSSGAKGGTVNGEANDGAIDNNITWNDPNIWDGSTDSLWNVPANWSKNAVPVAADVVIIPNVTNDPVLNTNGVCSGIIIQNGGLLTLSTASTTLTVTGNVTINTGGTLTMSAADTTLALNGSWSNSGTFNATNGKVCFNASAESQTIPAETFYNLDIDLASQVAATSGLVTVSNNLTVTNGTLRLDNQTMNVAGTASVGGNLEMLAGSDLKVTGAVTVSSGGVLDLQGSCTLRLGTSLTIDGGAPKGRLVASGTTPTITWDALSRYSCTVNGDIDVNGLNISYPDTNGVTITDDATISKLDAVDFNNGVTGTGTYLRILETGAAAYQFKQHDFDTNCLYNVYAASTNPTITMIGATGARAGEDYDNDPGTVITWTDQSVWDGSVDTTWNTAANWSDNAVPTAASNIFVPNTTNDCVVNIDTAAANAVQIAAVGIMRVGNAGTNVLTVSDSVTIDTDGTLILQNDATLNVAGNWTNNGSLTLNSGTTSGTVVFNGTSTLDNNTSGAGTETFDNLTVSGSLTVADNDSVTVTGTFNPTGGTLNAGSGTTLTTTGNWTAVPGTFTRGTSTVVLQGTANVPGVVYHNLTIDGACTLTGNITVMGNLVINATRSLNLATYSITVEGSITNSGTLNLGTTGVLVVKDTFTSTGTFTSGAGTRTSFQGTTQVIPALAYDILEINGPTATLAGNITINNLLDVDTGTLDIGSNTVTFGDGDSLLVYGTLMANGGTLISDNPTVTHFGVTINGTVDVSSLTVNSPDDNGISIANTATVTRLDNVIWSNGENAGASARYLSVSHAAGSFTFTGHNFTDQSFDNNVVAPNGATINMVNSSGIGGTEGDEGAIAANINWVNSNTWNGGSTTSWNLGANWSKGTIPVAGEVVIIPNGKPRYPELDVNASCESVSVENGATLYLNNANTLTVSGNVTIEAGGTIEMTDAAAKIALGGNWSNSGTFTSTLGTVCFNSSSSAQTIPTETFYQLEIDNSGQTATMAGTVTVSSNLVVTAGTLDTSNRTINVTGTSGISGTLDVSSGGILKSTGAMTVNSGGALNLDGTAELRLGTSLTVANGGSFSTTGATPTVTWDGITRYSFTVSGTINIGAMNLNYCDNNGLTINDVATVTDIDNLDCNNGLGTTTYLRILETGATTFSISGCDFDTNCQYNVYAASTNPTINMIGASGAKSGEAYDNDPGTVINWLTQNVWDGEISTSWNTAGNWTDAAVPSTEDTYVTNATYVCNVDIATAQCQSMEIDGNGTLVIDGGTDLLTVATDFIIGSTGTFTLSNGELRIAGNWNGNNNFTATGGMVTFNGGGAQTLNGTTAPTFYNLKVTNNSTVTVSSNVTVSNVLTIDSGSTVVVPSGKTLSLQASSTINGTLTLQPGSILQLADTITLTMSNSSTINAAGSGWSAGQFIKITSPGSGNNCTANLAGIVSLDYLRFDYPADDGLTLSGSSGKSVAASNVRLYDVATGGTYLLISGTDWDSYRFSGWGFEDVAGLGEVTAEITSGGRVLMESYETSSGYLFGEDTDIDTSGKVMWTVTAAMIDNLAARVDDEKVVLSWRSATEFNNAGYQVYRRELGEAATPSGKFGTLLNDKLIRGSELGSSQDQQYLFVDTSAEAGKSYSYRIADVDLGGNVSSRLSPVTVQVPGLTPPALAAILPQPRVETVLPQPAGEKAPVVQRKAVKREAPVPLSWALLVGMAALHLFCIARLCRRFKKRTACTVLLILALLLPLGFAAQQNRQINSRIRQLIDVVRDFAGDTYAAITGDRPVNTRKVSPPAEKSRNRDDQITKDADKPDGKAELVSFARKDGKDRKKGLETGEVSSVKKKGHSSSGNSGIKGKAPAPEFKFPEKPRSLAELAKEQGVDISGRDLPSTFADGLAQNVLNLSNPAPETEDLLPTVTPVAPLKKKPAPLPWSLSSLVPDDAMLLKITTSEEGLYRLSGNTLDSYGYNLKKPFVLVNKTGYVQLFPVPGTTDLCFYAPKYSTLYSDKNIFWLWQQKKKVKFAEGSASTAENVLAEYTAVSRFEENRSYRVNLPDSTAEDDHFFCQRYVMGGQSVDYALTCNDTIAGKAGVVRLKVRSYSPSTPSSHIRILVNGVNVGEYIWGGARSVAIEAAVPAGALTDGVNTVTISSFGDTGAPIEATFVDWIELKYQRPFVAVNGRLTFDTTESGVVTVAGLTTDKIVAARVDISPAQNVTEIKIPASGVATFAVESNARYEITDTNALLSPHGVKSANHVADATGLSCNYLIITTDALSDAAQQFAVYHRGLGRTVKVVTLADTLDAGDWGLYGPDAIKETLRLSNANYLLLVGDMTFDYFGVYTRDVDYALPAPFIVTQDYHAVSDYEYALVNGGVAVGRIPARTEAEVEAVLDKVKKRPGLSTYKLVTVADAGSAQFLNSSEHMAAQVSGNVVRIDMAKAGLADSKAALSAGWDDGAKFVCFSGHGSPTQWSQQRILQISDIPLLAPLKPLPIVIQLNCFSNAAQQPQPAGYSCIGEALLLIDGCGASSVIGSTAMTPPKGQQQLGGHILNEMDTNGMNVGQALLRTQMKLRAAGADKDVLKSFILLGDPAAY